MNFFKKSKVDPTIWKITFVNVQILFSPKEYQNWAKNYLTKNYNLNNWNLKTLGHFIPFIFGFSNMIWSRYQEQTIQTLFGQNIPLTKPVQEKINWETFKLIRLNTIDQGNINRIDLYPSSCILKFNKEKDKQLVGILFPKEQIFSIEDQNKRTKTKGFSNLEKIVFIDDLDSKNFFLKLEDIYYQLDELPNKIENEIEINSNLKETSNNSIFKKQLEDLINEKNRKKGLSKLEKNNYKINVPKSFFQKSKFDNYKNSGIFTSKPLGELSTNSPSLNENVRENRFLNSKERIFQNELNILFYKKGLKLNLIKNPYNEKLFNLLSISLSNPFNIYSAEETLKLLNDFIILNPSNQDSIKLFSDYKYPDLINKEIYSIKLNNLFEAQKTSPSASLTINLPTNFITSIRKNILLNSNCCTFLPISSRKDNFIGANSEETIVGETKNLKLNNLFINENMKRDSQTFEDFDDSDSTSWFLQLPKEGLVEAINFELNIFLNFLNNEIKKENLSHPIKLFEKNNIVYHFPQFSETFLIEKNSTLIKGNTLYKRRPTFLSTLNNKSEFLQKNNFSFFESWEPITVNSWMIITQFSIGLFLLQLVKDLYKDYGKELVEYILQFASSSGIDLEEIKEQYLYDDPGYRLIKRIKKSFKDIAGVDNIVLQLGEVVWFLRNQGRSSKLKNSIPNGILLTGPPGTGKTLLVQAIAGEAQVPIIVESGSLLTDPQQKGRGVERLKKIFDRARNLAPCIIFIDEVDTLGEKRQNIIQTPMGSDELIETIYQKTDEKETEFIPKPLNLEENQTGEKDLEYQLFRSENETDLKSEDTKPNIESKKTRLSLLTQLLVEMDGLKQRQGVIVIGATNRPNVLDPALIRPGRFDQIINLELPGKQKRIEIFKLYGKKLQIENSISWEYLAKRTQGFSAADIASAMNESTIQSIIAQTTHTIETIERGIDLVTSYNHNSKNLSLKGNSIDPFFISRLSYYQAGKAILQSQLKNHPSIVVLYLWPRQKNARHVRLFEKGFSEPNNRETLEAKLVGLYAGKAAEMIPLYGNKVLSSLKRWQSNLGEEDLMSASFLANLLVDKWYFYSTQVLIRKNNQILDTRNQKEFPDVEKLGLNKKLETNIEEELEIEKIAKLSRLGRYQQRGFGPWWQIQVAKQTSEIESFFADWYRIYLPDPEENILNLEWIPPDEYYHSNESLKKISKKSTLSFNELYKIERDYVFHGLILNSFNKALYCADTNRELLDYFSDYLIRFEILRETEIQMILKNSPTRGNKTYSNRESKDVIISEADDIKISEEKETNNQTNEIKILDHFWGTNSRRKNFRFLKSKIQNLSEKNSTYQSPFFKF